MVLLTIVSPPTSEGLKKEKDKIKSVTYKAIKRTEVTSNI